MATAAVAAESKPISQFSTLGALMQGDYDGPTTVAELRRAGELGLGTVNGLDGELLMVDGVVYQVTGEGKVNVLDDDTRVPFAMVSGFAPERRLALPPGTDFAGLERLLAANLESPNLFYAVRIDGRFRQLRTRSVPRQTPPYRPLAQVVEAQREFQFEDVEGTIVGFFSPPYVGGINVPGLHLHFVSRDRSGGGHVLAFETARAELALDRHMELRLILPEDPDFFRLDLQPPAARDLHKVERQQVPLPGGKQ